MTLHTNIKQPAIYLSRPLLAEVYGAGFTKSSGGRVCHFLCVLHVLPLIGTQFYELRHPRMSKIHRDSDRRWADGIHMDELERIALSTITIGKDPTNDDDDREIEEWCAELFRKADSLQKRRASDAFRSEEQAVPANKVAEAPPVKRARRDKDEENPQQTTGVAQKARMNNGEPLVPIENTRTAQGAVDAATCADAPTKAVVGGDDHEERRQGESSLMGHLQKSWIYIPGQNKGSELRLNVKEAQIVAANTIHLFEAFLAGCGWTSTNQRARPGRRRQGIIVVNKEESYEMMEKLIALARTTDDTDRKPIFILNLSAFSDLRQVDSGKDVVLEDYFVAKIV